MAEFKDLLARHDIVGGVIQVVRGAEVHRSDILGIEIDGTTLHIRSSKSLKGVQVDKGYQWVPCEKQRHYYELRGYKLIGVERPQFDITGGWVIIFPKGDVVAL